MGIFKDGNENAYAALKEFYRGKRVLLTGHTGFKGAWMSLVLLEMGASVTGYSLEPPTTPNLHSLLQLGSKMNSIIGDIRDLDHLKRVFEGTKPEIVIHMAAQPIVRESYKNPVYTYSVNVMGTVNVLECSRLCESVRSVVNVTTDKVYRNNEWERGYVESDYLDGYDPYSNSKSCSELVTHSYFQSFFSGKSEDESNINTAVSTCRAGNVIGGGDFAIDRIIPDCYRFAAEGKKIEVRNPYSVRPYQHVLEPIFAYLLLAMRQYSDHLLSGAYNIGPNDSNCISTGDIVSCFTEKWNCLCKGEKIDWVNVGNRGPHEANILKLNCSKIEETLRWKNAWNIDETMSRVVEWYYGYFAFEDVWQICKRQINDYCEFF